MNNGSTYRNKYSCKWTLYNAVTAESPLIGILGDANSGGFLGSELKYVVYDQIIITGKAKEPVYISF